MTPPADAVPLPGLAEPSLGETRARLIAERLAAPGLTGRPLPRVAVTGKTGAGKSTLGNLLCGAQDVLAATGHADCTDAVYRLRFPRGLIYLDLPGVASADLLENYNRIALGLPPHPGLARPTEISVIDYDARRQSDERRYPAGALPPGTVSPDVILYLIAPHQTVNRDEEGYLRDLLRAYGRGRVLVVFNLHHDQAGRRLATDANIADARNRVTGCYRAAGTVPGAAGDGQDAVMVDCKGGTGLPDLLSALRRPLGADLAAPLADVVRYQAERAPQAWCGEVHRAVADYAAGLAAASAPSEAAATATAIAAARVLADRVARLSGRAVTATVTGPKLQKLAGRVSAGLRIEHAEPVFKEEQRPVYRQVPVYSKRKVTDYDKPITMRVKKHRKRDPEDFGEFLDSLGGWLNGDGYGVDDHTYETKVIGYETRKIKEITGYRDELDHIETYTVQTGTQMVLTGYRPFGEQGIAFALTAWYLGLRAAAGVPGSSPEAIYQQILTAVRAGGAPGASASSLPSDAEALLEKILER